jgi:hypothetical protein
MSPDDPTLVVTSIESRGSGQRIVCVRAKNQFGEDFRLTTESTSSRGENKNPRFRERAGGSNRGHGV